MNPQLYEHIQKQTWPQRIVTAIFYPVFKLIAMYFAVLFFGLMLEELEMNEVK